MKKLPFTLLVGAVALLSSCATNQESLQRESLEQASSVLVQQSHEPLPSGVAGGSNSSRLKVDTESGKASQPPAVAQYVSLAMEQSPELRGAFERWRASVSRISRARRLPDPQISFGYFVRPVETRVGPQRARIGLSQTFPWPTKLTAGADATSARARAQESQFEALALVIRRRVVSAYYRLWLIRKTRKIHAEHLEVMRSLSETVLARVATGATTLADQQQIDLSAARLEDKLKGMDESEVAAIAQLRAAIGNRDMQDFPTESGPPPAGEPVQQEGALIEISLQHPLLDSMSHEAVAHEESARSEEAAGLPSFSLGADWIITGESPNVDVTESGKDALIFGGAVTVPLWRGSYGDAASAARAEASAVRADRAAAQNLVISEVQISLSKVRDSVRRVRLHRSTLVPQADSAYASVLGAYVSGQGSLAQTLIAQKDLLELREELEVARADYALAWARLERAVGRAIRAERSLPQKREKP